MSKILKQDSSKVFTDMLMKDDIGLMINTFGRLKEKYGEINDIMKDVDTEKLDNMHEVFQKIPEEIRIYPYIIVSEVYGIRHDFTLGRLKDKKDSEFYRKSKIIAYSKFGNYLNDHWEILSPEEKAKKLIELYESGKKKTFSWVLQKASMGENYKIFEAMKENEGFPYFITVVQNTRSRDPQNIGRDTDIVLVAENTPIDQDTDGLDGISIISISRSDEKLRDFIRRAIANDGASIGYGKYRKDNAGNDTFESVACLEAAFLYAIENKSNFYANAYDRIEKQLDDSLKYWHGKDTGYMFLKTKENSNWARVISSMKTSEWNSQTKEQAREKAKILSEYNFNRLLDLHMIMSGDEMEEEILSGWNEAILKKIEEAKELSSFDEEPCQTLDFYKGQFGFHPKFPANMPISLQKKGACADICEQITGLMGAHILFARYQKELNNEINNGYMFNPKEIMNLFIDIKYVDGMERMLGAFSSFIVGDKTSKELFDVIKNRGIMKIQLPMRNSKENKQFIDSFLFEDELYVRFKNTLNFIPSTEIFKGNNIQEEMILMVALNTTVSILTKQDDGKPENKIFGEYAKKLDFYLKKSNESVMKKQIEIHLEDEIGKTAELIFGEKNTETMNMIREAFKFVPKKEINKIYWEMTEGNPKPAREAVEKVMEIKKDKINIPNKFKIIKDKTKKLEEYIKEIPIFKK